MPKVQIHDGYFCCKEPEQLINIISHFAIIVLFLISRAVLLTKVRVMKSVREVIYQRISDGDVEGAIDLLMEILREKKNDQTYKDALFLKSNLHSARQQYEIKGVIARQEYELIVNRTLLGLESILDGLDNGRSSPPIPAFHREEKVSPERGGMPLWVGLVMAAVILSVVIYFVIDNTTVRESATSPLNQAVANWQGGQFRNAIGDLEIIRNEAEPELQARAESRLTWLAPFGRRRFFFIDDFEAPPANQRWEFAEGRPGPGEFLIREGAEGRILQLAGHEHAYPQAEAPEHPIAEVQFRFRIPPGETGGLHVNLCMETPPPVTRTTIGFYPEDRQIRIWEAAHNDVGNEVEYERGMEFNLEAGRWYRFQAMIDGGYVQVLLNGEPVLDYESARGRIPLQGFNLESLAGTVQVDDFLLVGP